MIEINCSWGETDSKKTDSNYLGETLTKTYQVTSQLDQVKTLLTAEVANTRASREKGLMFRTKFQRSNHGMLFQFESPGIHCFWMKNTFLALSIAFLDEKGTILSTEEMVPLTNTLHCPLKNSSQALEMPEGWFLLHKIVPGDRLQTV